MWTGRAMAGYLVVIMMSLPGAARAQAPELGQPLADPTAWRCPEPTTCTKVGRFDGRSGIWSVDRDAEQVVTDVRFTTFWVPPEVPRSPVAAVSTRPATASAAWFDAQLGRLRTQGWAGEARGADVAELRRLDSKLEASRWTTVLKTEGGRRLESAAVQLRWLRAHASN